MKQAVLIIMLAFIGIFMISTTSSQYVKTVEINIAIEPEMPVLADASLGSAALSGSAITTDAGIDGTAPTGSAITTDAGIDSTPLTDSAIVTDTRIGAGTVFTVTDGAIPLEAMPSTDDDTSETIPGESAQ